MGAKYIISGVEDHLYGMSSQNIMSNKFLLIILKLKNTNHTHIHCPIPVRYWIVDYFYLSIPWQVWKQHWGSSPNVWMQSQAENEMYTTPTIKML